ncbi:MAG TPA: polyprenyl diphosphate synthase [Candidatus Binatia bacterium]|nr:polyprenyl diphosphate synthase [Candidatus Binatia bacterium]
MTSIPPAVPKDAVPRHVAIIMDGNGRWAQNRGRPRGFGHRAGVRSARRILRAAHRQGVEALTVFAFSQENWQRPENEVSLLMQLFLQTLSREIASLHKNQVRLRFIGDHAGFPRELRELMRESERRTAANAGLKLSVAVGYGGQWDILQAVARCAADGVPLEPRAVAERLQTAGLPEVDLLIRTGGERRISNFMLWQLAYTELYFADTLWPEFGEPEFVQALTWYAGRERRFGRVPEGA